MLWQPDQDLEEDYFMIKDFGMRFCIAFYSSILAVLGNDIAPATLFQYFLASVMLIFGALLQASIFGQVASIV